MAIKISNFSPVWKFVRSDGSTSENPQFLYGTYLFLLMHIQSGSSVSVSGQLWDKKPEPGENGEPNVNGAKIVNLLFLGNLETNIQGNILEASSNFVVNALQEINPSVTFEITGINP